jgi:hypothetical protein
VKFQTPSGKEIQNSKFKIPRDAEFTGLGTWNLELGIWRPAP